MIENWQLSFRQNMPLWLKIAYTKKRIVNWYGHNRGQVYVSFSGGKDSTVLLHLVRELYPNIKACFVDTGLEYPEIVDFVRQTPNVVWLHPELSFKKVIERFGYPVVSKFTAHKIRILQNAHSGNKATCNLYMTGITRDGRKAPNYKLPEKWKYLVDCGMNIGEQCCDVLKKNPLKKYGRLSGESPFVGVMAKDSQIRRRVYLNHGCNSFNAKTPMSAPLSFWGEEDIWKYIKERKLPYCSIYDSGIDRTGCMFCMFGVHREKGENRFQLMKKSHPSQYKYCINKLGIGKMLKILKVSY